MTEIEHILLLSCSSDICFDKYALLTSQKLKSHEAQMTKKMHMIGFCNLLKFTNSSSSLTFSSILSYVVTSIYSFSNICI